MRGCGKSLICNAVIERLPCLRSRRPMEADMSAYYVRIALILSVIVLLALNVQAQEAKQESHQLGIEISVPDSDRPSFYVPSKLADSKPIFALIPPIIKSSAKVSKYPLYIKVLPISEDNKVKITVSILYGKAGKIETVEQSKNLDEVNIGSFIKADGDSIEVVKLADYGVTPISIKVISKPRGKGSDSNDSANNIEKAMSERQRRGVDIIKNAASEASSLDDRRSSIRILGKAADALWEKDKEYSRQLFRKAFEDALEYHNDVKDDGLERMTRNLYMSHPDIRLEIIRLVSRRDVRLSQEFIDRYTEEKLREEKERRQIANSNSKVSFDPAFGQVDAASGDKLHLVEQLLEVDKKAAIELGGKAFISGIPQAAGYFFTMLAEKDRAAADQLYSMALERLKNDNAPVPGQLLLLSAYPFGDNQVWISSGQGVNMYKFPVPPNFKIDQALINRFFSVSFYVISRNVELDVAQLPDASARLGAALFAIRVIEPKVAQFQPKLLNSWLELGMRLSAKVADIKLRDGVEKDFQDIAKERQAETTRDLSDKAQQLLNEAQKTTDPNRRDELYQDAAFEADLNSDTDKALNIADRISNVDLRRETKSWINFNAASRAINDNRLDEARYYANEVIAADERAYLFSEMARSSLGRNDKERAQILLEEALQNSSAADDTAEKLRALLVLASVYATIDQERSFQIISTAIVTANRILEYKPERARLVRKFESRSGKKSRVVVQQSQDLDLGTVLSTLARKDFDRALVIAQSLENQSLRLMTLIAVSSSVFARDEKPSANVTKKPSQNEK